MNKLIITISALLIGLSACTSKQTVTEEPNSRPNYTQPLQPGMPALTVVDKGNWPDLGIAWDSKDLFLVFWAILFFYNHSLKIFYYPK